MLDKFRTIQLSVIQKKKFQNFNFNYLIIIMNPYDMQSQKEDAKNINIDQEINIQQEKERDKLRSLPNQQQTLQNWDYFQQYVEFLSIPEIQFFFCDFLQQLYYQPAHQDTNQACTLKSLLLNQHLITKIKKHLQDQLISNNFLIQDQNRSNLSLSQQKQSQKATANYEIIIKIINNMESFQVIEIYVSYASYSKTYTVLNVIEPSCRHSLKRIGFGGMGEIYQNPKFQSNSQTVVKCLKANQDEETLNDRIKQFFITDILSSLQIGPKVIKNYGFDFITYEGCMEFEIEKCESFKNQNLQKQLKLSLMQMHILQINHADIKPSNIMYSPTFKKNVFIDFGISDILKQMMSQKTFVKFKGTYQFCGEQMKQLISKKQAQFIDLYKNDVIMLINSMNFIKSPIKKENIIMYGKQIDKKGNQAEFLQEEYFSQKDYNYFKVTQWTKFILYKSQNNRKILQEKLKLLAQFIQTLQHKILIQRYVKQILVFAKNLKSIVTSLILEDKVFSSYSYSINFLEILNEKTSQNKGIHYFYVKSQYERKRVLQRINLLKKMQIRKKEKAIIPNKDIFEKKKILKRANIQFILFKKEQSQKLKKEDYYEFFITYSSIWSNNYKNLPIQYRLKAAQVFKQVISNKLDFCMEYLQESYLPEDDFIQNQLHDLVWAYGYLLSYCTQEPMDQFKIRNIMLIAKETILFNFKYFLYLVQIFSVFAEYLIRNKIRKLVSLIIIQKSQLLWLIKNQYCLTSLPKSLSQRKIERIQQKSYYYAQKLPLRWIKYKFQKLIWSKQQQKFRQTAVFCICQELEYADKNMYQKRLFELLDQQFEKQNELNELTIEIKRYYTYALQLLELIIRCFSIRPSHQNLLFKTKLAKLLYNLQEDYKFDTIMDIVSYEYINGNNFLELKVIDKVDSKIGCREISKYFFIYQKLRLAILNKNILNFQEIIYILAHDTPFLLVNSQIQGGFQLVRFNQISFLPLLNSTIKQNYSIFIFKHIRFMTLSLYRNFMQNQFQLIRINCLYICNNFQYIQETLSQKFQQNIKTFVSNQLSECLEKYLEQNINRIELYRTIFALYTFKLTIEPKMYSVKYFKIKRQLFQYALNFIKQYEIVYPPPQTKISFQIYAAFPMIFKTRQIDNLNISIQNQITKGWQNTKLRLLLYQEHQNLHQCFLFFIKYVFELKNLDILVELFLIFSQRILFQKQAQYLNILDYQIKLIYYYKLDSQFCSKLCQKLILGTNNYLRHVHVFPIFIHFLTFDRFFKNHEKLWKITLILSCKFFQVYPLLEKQEKFLKTKRLQQILFGSVVYSEKLKKNRKYSILIRNWIKYPHGKNIFIKQNLQDYFKKYVNLINNFISNQIPSQHNRQILLQKKQKYLRNIFDQQYCNYLNSHKIFKLQQIKTKQQNQQNNKYLKIKPKSERSDGDILKQLAQRYKIINIQALYQQTFAKRQDFLNKFIQLLDLQQRLKQYQINYILIQQNINQNQKKEILNLPMIRIHAQLKYKYQQLSKEVNQKIKAIKSSQSYLICQQLQLIQYKILQLQRTKLIQKLIEVDKLVYNQIQNKFETINDSNNNNNKYFLKLN